MGNTHRHLYIAAQHASEKGERADPEQNSEYHSYSEREAGQRLCPSVKNVRVSGKIYGNEDNEEGWHNECMYFNESVIRELHSGFSS